ncbi:MAG TPA: DsbA family protein [Candidatus Binataceae bacterium]|nr:DsbA family protein [Candidatus Binataceae bacterium]
MPAPFDPLGSSAPLIVYLDYKSPYAYLAKDPTYALADELGIEIDWRPFTLDIPSYLGSAKLGADGKVAESQRTPGQWTRVKHAYHDVRRYASLRGLTVRGTVKIWDSSLGGIGMLFAKSQGQQVLRAYSGLVYERFWKRELDLEDLSVIERVLGECGANTHDFREYAAGEGRALHDQIQHAAFEAGIFGVPTFIIDREIYFGREHLPRVRWLLTGRKGASPDIAYPVPASSSPGRAAKGPLTVAIDFNSPQSYLAIAPTCALSDQLGIEIDWQPMITTRFEPPPGSGNDRGTRHRRIRAAYLERDVARYAAARGVVIGGLDRHKDSTHSALGLLWVKRQDPDQARTYVERVFEREGRGELNIGSEPAVRALLGELGIQTSGFESYAKGEGREQLAQVQADLQTRGAYESPAYLVNDDVYLGRQHLPMVRALLSTG